MGFLKLRAKLLWVLGTSLLSRASRAKHEASLSLRSMGQEVVLLMCDLVHLSLSQLFKLVKSTHAKNKQRKRHRHHILLTVLEGGYSPKAVSATANTTTTTNHHQARRTGFQAPVAHCVDSLC